MSAPAPLLPRMALALGVAAVSASAVLVRLAQQLEVPSEVIAWGRLGIASLLLTPAVMGRYGAELARLRRSELALALAAGALLALHFVTWIVSLEYTSVLASVVLVSASPLFVALLSFPLLGERVGRRLAASILLAFLGALLVAAARDPGQAAVRAQPLLGNALALCGAVAMALYLLIGRRLRPRLSLLPYIWMVYLAAAAFLTLWVGAAAVPVAGHPATAWVLIAGLAVGPQLLGHTSFNYALRYFPASIVGLVTLGEPLGSTLLAVVLLGEVPRPLSVAGALLILAGIAHLLTARYSEKRIPARKIE